MAIGLDRPPVRSPTHLLPPTAAVAAQMDALQRNDYPDNGAGVRTCFRFSKPEDESQAFPSRVRSWGGAEEWLGLEEFSSRLCQPPYSALLNCDSWRVSLGQGWVEGVTCGSDGAVHPPGRFWQLAGQNTRNIKCGSRADRS
jgi:hypothetical protein